MWQRRRQSDFDAEIQAHLEVEASRLRAEGLSEEEARLAARRRFGNVASARERFYEASRWSWLDHLTRDFRDGIRRLSKGWGFTLGAGSVLALGIAASTAIFSVVNGVLLQPLSYPDADRIVSVETFWKDRGRASRRVSGPDFRDWQRQSTMFEVMAYHATYGETPIVLGGHAEYAGVQHVGAGFFRVFGRAASAGRLITEKEARAPVAVVSYHWAQAHFGSSTTAIGRRLVVQGKAVEILGVAAPGFRYDDTDIWTTDQIEPGSTSRTAGNYVVVGKLKRGVDLAQARQQMRLIGDRIAGDHPENRHKTVALIPLHERLTGDVETTLWVLMGAVFLVMLIACANIAHLLLARATTRTREIALRVALGAGRGRVIGQLLTESVVLAALSATFGLGLAHLLVRALVTLSPADLPRLDEVRVDQTVMLFALGLSVASVLLFGLVPALHASRLDLSDALKQGGSKGAVSAGTGGARSALVVAEVALSVVLLIGAALLLRSFQVLHQVDVGFATERVLLAHTSYAQNAEEDGRRAVAFYQDLLERVRGVPGVRDAAGASHAPLSGASTDAGYHIEGRPEPPPGESDSAEMQVITPRYFRVLGIPLRLGRDFDARDTLGRQPVAIINEALAREAFQGQSPLGQRIRTGFRETTMQWMEIVGVAADTRRLDPSRPPQPELFVAAAQHPEIQGLSILVRTSQDQDSLAGTLRTVVHETDPTVPVRFETMDRIFAQALAYPRFRTQLVGAFAAMAVLVALVGLFGLLTYLVGQRTKELAVRLTVGARPTDIVRLIVGHGTRLTIVGLAIGLAGALAVAQFLSSLLYEVSPWDWLTYLAVVVLLGVAAIVATLVPAIRAATIDPLVALRQE
ncbi:MAG: ADOP family duplicated permease [Vicinamibacteraceae bacterium]